VLTEGYDATFLSRHFDRADGVLYEGGTLQDIDSDPRVVSGREKDGAPLRQLIAAARLPDPAQRLAAVSRWIDLDQFLSMVAVETLLCHSDSYTMNRNNYRFYYDPSKSRFTFMPHGMDRILGQHRSPLDLTILPPQLGLVSRAILTTEPGRRQYFNKLGLLLTNLFQPGPLEQRIREIDARINQFKADAPPPRRQGRLRVAAPDSRHDADEIAQRVSERAADVTGRSTKASFPTWSSPGSPASTRRAHFHCRIGSCDRRRSVAARASGGKSKMGGRFTTLPPPTFPSCFSTA
jgi:hypothetical protein